MKRAKFRGRARPRIAVDLRSRVHSLKRLRVALKHTGPLGAAEIFTAQGRGGRSHEIRRFSPLGVLVDFILEDDPEFANGIWLG